MKDSKLTPEQIDDRFKKYLEDEKYYSNLGFNSPYWKKIKDRIELDQIKKITTKNPDYDK